MNICIIPARGGSKRIPRKNIRLFCGKPMISWSIAAAIESRCFDHVAVSTEDEEVAEIARLWGAEVPFKRPLELADDHSPTNVVIAHAIEWFVSQGQAPENVCCLYATAPFATGSDLRRGLSVLETSECDYAFSVTSYPFPIQRAVRITKSCRVEMFNSEYSNTRSQDLEEAYHDAGQFYWGKSKAWQDKCQIFGRASVPVLIPRYRVQDIDTHEDWIRAEWLFKAMQETEAG